jgi:hypothetical protein
VIGKTVVPFGLGNRRPVGQYLGKYRRCRPRLCLARNIQPYRHSGSVVGNREQPGGIADDDGDCVGLAASHAVTKPQPVTDHGENRVDNGLLLRSNVHTLFNRGTVSYRRLERLRRVTGHMLRIRR